MKVTPPETPHRSHGNPLHFEPDFGRYYALVQRRLWLIVAIIGLVMLAAIAWLLRQPKIYSSNALLQIEQLPQEIIKVDNIQPELMDSTEYLKTMEQAISNDSVLYNVVKSAKLDEDPNFAPPLPGNQKYSEAQLSELMSEKVTVKLQRGTRLISVAVEDPSPQRAKELADLMVKEFLRQCFAQRLTLSKVANDFLVEEGDKLKRQLEESQLKLQTYKEQHNAVSLEQTQNITIDKLKAISTQVTDAKSARLSLESDLEQLKKLPKDDIDSMLQIGSVAAIRDVATIREQLFKSQADLASVQKRYLSKHPKNIEAQAAVDRLRQSLRDTLQNATSVLQRQYESAQSTESKLTEALHEQETAALELNKIAIPYNVLAREVDSDQQMYQAIITRQRETMMTQSLENSPFRIIQEPMVSSRPVKPRVLLTLAIALCVGCGLAGCTVMGLEIINDTFRFVDEAEDMLGLPVLSVVPKIKNAQKEDVFDVFASEQSTEQAEPFRTLRASLSLLGEESQRRTFLITSSIPDEGKSFTAYNTAVVFAAEGRKTLLIDCDLRRPSLQRILKDNKKPPFGLVDYLTGNASEDKIIHPGDHDNLSIIFAGNRAPNPGDLLDPESFTRLIQHFLEKYDRIVVDSSPVNAVSDSLRIASSVDYVCLVIRAEKTPKRAVLRTKHLVQKAGGKIAGFVLNRVSLGAGSAYYYYHYNYGDPGTDGKGKAQEAGGRAARFLQRITGFFN